MSKSDSTAQGFAHKTGKPNKPFPEFPLFPHATKRWAKKIRGKLHYFGSWDDPDGALKKYEEQKIDLHAGRKPRDTPEGVTVKILCNEFLNHKQAKLDAGELSPRTWDNYKQTADFLIAQLGKGRLVADLRPDDFAALKKVMSKQWGPVRVRNFVQQVRSVFKYGHEAEVLTNAVRFGPGFARPTKKTLRLERAKKGPRMFEAEELRRLINGATIKKESKKTVIGPTIKEVTVKPTTSLKAMILLGVNCGFGNADCGTLPLSALNLQTAMIDFPRPKTGLPRRCPLWPETVAALRAVITERPAPSDPADKNLLFLTWAGASWNKDTSDNPVSKEMRKYLNALGIDGNRNFYALRHTFETIGGEAKDQVAVDHIMGHARDDMASVYRERISDERLKAVSDHVRKWVFEEKPSVS